MNGFNGNQFPGLGPSLLHQRLSTTASPAKTHFDSHPLLVSPESPFLRTVSTSDRLAGDIHDMLDSRIIPKPTLIPRA